MKFAKLFMAAAVVCFAVACAGDKKEDAKEQKTDDAQEEVAKTPDVKTDIDIQGEEICTETEESCTETTEESCMETAILEAGEYAEACEWVKAAEAIAQLDPADTANEIIGMSETAMGILLVVEVIANSDDEEAIAILEEWSGKVEIEVEKLGV